MLTPADVRQPNGDVEDAWFPGKSGAVVDAWLQTWLDAALEHPAVLALPTLLAREQAAKRWALYKAAAYRYNAYLPIPGRRDVADKGGETITDAQRTEMKLVRDALLAEYERQVTPSPVVTGYQSRNRGGGGSVRLVREF